MPPTTNTDTDNLGEGDSHLVLNLLPEDENWMEKLKREVQFRVMLHRGVLDIFTSTGNYDSHFPWGSQGGKFLGWSRYRVR